MINLNPGVRISAPPDSATCAMATLEVLNSDRKLIIPSRFLGYREYSSSSQVGDLSLIHSVQVVDYAQTLLAAHPESVPYNKVYLSEEDEAVFILKSPVIINRATFSLANDSRHTILLQDGIIISESSYIGGFGLKFKNCMDNSKQIVICSAFRSANQLEMKYTPTGHGNVSATSSPTHHLADLKICMGSLKEYSYVGGFTIADLIEMLQNVSVYSQYRDVKFGFNPETITESDFREITSVARHCDFKWSNNMLNTEACYALYNLSDQSLRSKLIREEVSYV